MRKKVCLITGGAGFLGKKYCEMFLKQNYIVICIWVGFPLYLGSDFFPQPEITKTTIDIEANIFI